MREVITKAIQGGWKAFGTVKDVGTMNEESWRLVYQYLEQDHTWQEITSDAEFWKCLGKAMGWRKDPSPCDWCQVIGSGESNHFTDCPKKNRPGDVMMHWHRFIDHLAEEKDAESFFTNLIAEK